MQENLVLHGHQGDFRTTSYGCFHAPDALFLEVYALVIPEPGKAGKKIYTKEANRSEI
jgi:hypothetical protein